MYAHHPHILTIIQIYDIILSYNNDYVHLINKTIQRGKSWQNSLVGCCLFAERFF